MLFIWIMVDAERSVALSSTDSNIIKSDLSRLVFLPTWINVSGTLFKLIHGCLGWSSAQTGVIRISETRLQKCLANIDKALSNPNLSARDLALLGTIISKHCQMTVAAAQDCDTPSP